MNKINVLSIKEFGLFQIFNFHKRLLSNKIVTIILYCFFTIFAYGQTNFVPGYIIDNNGEKISGFIDYRNWDINPSEINFKRDLEKVDGNYFPQSIKEFGVENDVYISAATELELSPRNLNNLSDSAKLHLKKETVFLQALVLGEKSLYRHMTKSGFENFYIKQGNEITLLEYKKYKKYIQGKLVVKEIKNYANQLNAYLDHCKQIGKSLNNLKYNNKDLDKLFEDYYDLCSSETVNFSKGVLSMKYNLGFFGGITNTKVQFASVFFNYLTEVDFDVSRDYTAGIYFELVFPKYRQKWSMNNEILFTNFEINGEYIDVENENVSFTTRSKFAYTHVKLMSMIRYKYEIGSSRFFVDTGISNGLIVQEKENEKNEEINVYAEQRFRDGKGIEVIRKPEFGVLVGLGYGINRFSLECRYEIATGFSGIRDLAARTNRLYVLLGVNIF